jgi:MoxR-like ATPase
VVEPGQLGDARESIAEIHIAEDVREYILDLVEATRSHADVEHGASPRASLAFLNTAKARAALDGRDYVVPDDVKTLTEQVLVHRLVLSTDARLGDLTPRDVVDDIVDTVTPPGARQADEETPVSADGRGETDTE